MFSFHAFQVAQDRVVKGMACLGAAWAGLVMVWPRNGEVFLATLGESNISISRLAAGLMLGLGAALFLGPGPSRSRSRAALALVVLVGLVALWAAAEYTFGPRMPLLPEALAHQGTLKPKLSVLTIGSILCLALAVACTPGGAGRSWIRRQAGGLLALPALGVFLLVLVSYAAGAPLLYGSESTPMALPTACIGLVLSLAALAAAGPDTLPLALFGSHAARAPGMPLRRGRRAPTGVFLALAVAILAGGAVILRSQIRSARSGVQEELAAIAELKAGQIANWYDLRRGNLMQVTRSVLVQNQFRRFLVGAAQDGARDELVDWMEKLRRGEGYSRAVLFDGGGRPRLAVPTGKGVPSTPEFRSQVRAALLLKRTEALDAKRRLGTSEPNLSLWVPIGLRRGHGTPALGVLLFQVDARPVLGRITMPWPRAPSSAEVQLVGRDQQEAVLLSEPRHPVAGNGAPRFSLVQDPDRVPVIAAHGWEGPANGMDYRGVRVMASVKRVRETPWSLVAQVDESEVYGPMRQRALSTGLLLLALVLLAALGTALVVRHQDAGRILGALAAERERKVLAERSDHLMRLANDIIILTDMEGRILETNVAASETLGYGPEQFRRMELRHLRRPEMAAELLARFQALKAAGSARFESRYLRKDGTEFPVEISARVIELGGEAFVLHFVRDISESKRVEEERRQLEARLHQTQRLESLGSLAGGVAHDMNNVLGAILSLASSRREGMDASDPLGSTLDTIANACLRGRGVVRSLLYFARQELEETKPVDLNELVRDMVQLLGFTTLKRIGLEVELQDPLPPVLGDRGALSHALMNLAVNALDAMPGQGTLRLRTEGLPDGKVKVSVIDNGEGMTPEVLAKAVEPFYTTKPVGKGTGLGLAMVFGTVKAHGGELELRSSPGQGTEVILTLPALEPAPAAPEPAAACAAAVPPGEPLRILVVDDDELIRESLVPMLEILGHSAQAAPGGLEALDLIRGGLDPDLVILDMNMPGIDGAETLARIKSLRPGQAVLMASGYSDSDINALASGQSGVQCIQKPFTMHELQLKIAALTPSTVGPASLP